MKMFVVFVLLFILCYSIFVNAETETTTKPTDTPTTELQQSNNATDAQTTTQTTKIPQPTTKLSKKPQQTTKNNFQLWLNAIKERNVTFDEYMQKRGNEVLKPSILQFERVLVKDKRSIKAKAHISWISSMQFCFQPWFEPKDFKPIEDQASFFCENLNMRMGIKANDRVKNSKNLNFVNFLQKISIFGAKNGFSHLFLPIFCSKTRFLSQKRHFLPIFSSKTLFLNQKWHFLLVFACFWLKTIFEPRKRTELNRTDLNSYAPPQQNPSRFPNYCFQSIPRQ